MPMLFNRRRLDATGRQGTATAPTQGWSPRPGSPIVPTGGQRWAGSIFFTLLYFSLYFSFLGGHHARLQLCLLQLPRAQHGAGLWLDPLRWDDTGLTILPLNICIFMLSDALGGQQRANAGFPRGGGQNDQRHCHWWGKASTSLYISSDRSFLRYSAPV